MKGDESESQGSINPGIKPTINEANLFIKIWTGPSETLTYILQYCPEKYVTVFLILGIFLFVNTVSFAQTKGYIVHNDTIHSGVKISFNPTDPWVMNVKFSNRQSQKFSPGQIPEFGFNDGTIYLSKEIFFKGEYRQVFLELLEDGNINLFKLAYKKNKYFIEDDSLFELNRNNYTGVLKNYAEKCKTWEEQYKYIQYHEESLSNFVRQFNLNDCGSLPFLSFGPVLGYTFSRISSAKFPTLSQEPENSHIGSSNISIGLFVEKPFWHVNNLSWTGEIRWEKQNYIKAFFLTNKNQDVKITMNNIALKFAPKYTFNQVNPRPFFFFGGYYNLVFQSSNEFFNAQLDYEQITFQKSEDILDLTHSFFGFTLGTGIHWFMGQRPYFKFEFSVSPLFSGDQVNIINSNFSIKTNL